MSQWKLPNKTGFATWGDTQETWGDPFATWGATVEVWTNQTKTSSTFTLETKNIVSSTEQELLIDDTYSFSLDGTYELLIQSEGTGYALQNKNSSTFTLQNVSNPKIETFDLGIDDTYELLIDDNYSLELQSVGVPENWQLQTKN